MTEIINFEDQNIEVKIVNGERFVSGIDICKALEYKIPNEAESLLFLRNKEQLESRTINGILFHSENKLSDDRSKVGRPKKQRFYSQVGAILLIMKSETEKAEALQVFIAECFIEFMNQRLILRDSLSRHAIEVYEFLEMNSEKMYTLQKLHDEFGIYHKHAYSYPTFRRLLFEIGEFTNQLGRKTIETEGPIKRKIIFYYLKLDQNTDDFILTEGSD